MRRLLASGLALALAVLAVTTFARTPAAQTADRALEACAPGKETIDARALPAAAVTPERCPVAGREIEDGPVTSAVPAPGEGIYAETLATGGAPGVGGAPPRRRCHRARARRGGARRGGRGAAACRGG